MTSPRQKRIAIVAIGVVAVCCVACIAFGTIVDRRNMAEIARRRANCTAPNSWRLTSGADARQPASFRCLTPQQVAAQVALEQRLAAARSAAQPPVRGQTPATPTANNVLPASAAVVPARPSPTPAPAIATPEGVGAGAPAAGPAILPGDRLRGFLVAHVTGGTVTSAAINGSVADATVTLARAATPSQFIHFAGDMLTATIGAPFWTSFPDVQSISIRVERGAFFMVVPASRGGAPRTGAATSSDEQVAGDLAARRFWEDEAREAFGSGACPEGVPEMFALPFDPLRAFNDQDESAADRATSARERSTSGRRARSASYVISAGATLGEYDRGQQRFPVGVNIGDHNIATCGGEPEVSLALGAARSVNAVPDFGDHDVLVNHEWRAQPLQLALHVAPGDADAYRAHHDGHLRIQIAFRIGSTETDRRVARTSAGVPEDFGSGALVHGQVTAVRLYNDQDETILLDTAPTRRAGH